MEWTEWTGAVSEVVADLHASEQRRRQEEDARRRGEARIEECRRHGVDPSAVGRRVQGGADFRDALAAEVRTVAFERGRAEGRSQAVREVAGLIEGDERRLRVVPPAAKVPTRRELVSAAMGDADVRRALDDLKADWAPATPDDGPKFLGP